jgi:outer membrane protein OmpA-like peptidoglycan-associated protein
MAKEMITPEAIEKAAQTTGESPDGMGMAMHGGVHAIFASLTHSLSMPGGAENLFSTLTQGGATTGHELTNKLLGERTEAVSDVLANSTGISSSSAMHVLALTSPMVAGVLGKLIFSKQLSKGGLANLLSGHREAILDDPHALPGLAGALGLGSLSELGSPAGVWEPQVSTETASAHASVVERMEHAARAVESPVERAVRAVERPVERAARAMERPVLEAKQEVKREFEKPHRWGVILPVLILGALAIWGVIALGQSHEPRIGVTAPQITTPSLPRAPEMPSVQMPSAPKVETPAMGSITLPGGKALEVDPKGPAAELVHYFNDSSLPLPHTFVVETLNFDTGMATLTADSRKTVDELATILKAYPSARVQLLGHTDTTGEPSVNDALSQARATSVADSLTAGGVASSRIETTGKGERNPVASNESQEGRASNRRVDIVLLSR